MSDRQAQRRRTAKDKRRKRGCNLRRKFARFSRRARRVEG